MRRVTAKLIQAQRGTGSIGFIRSGKKALLTGLTIPDEIMPKGSPKPKSESKFFLWRPRTVWRGRRPQPKINPTGSAGVPPNAAYFLQETKPFAEKTAAIARSGIYFRGAALQSRRGQHSRLEGFEKRCALRRAAAGEPPHEMTPDWLPAFACTGLQKIGGIRRSRWRASICGGMLIQSPLNECARV